MIDIEAEARKIVDGKGEAWTMAVEKLSQAWADDDQAAITAWRAVFGRYPELAYELHLDDGFYDYNIWMNAGHYAAGLDLRPGPPLSAEDAAALAADEAAWRAELDTKADEPPRPHELDDDISY